MKKYITCKKLKAFPRKQDIASLPRGRINKSLSCEIDFGILIYIKAKSEPPKKAHIVLFICGLKSQPSGGSL